MREKLINLICKLIPILIIAVTIIGFFFALGIGKINWALQGLYLAIPAVIACLIIYDSKGNNIDFESAQNLVLFDRRILFFLFFILFSLCIIGLNLLSNGDIVFNFGIVLLYIIIIIQIFFNKDISDYFIIFEIASIIFLFFYRHVINVPLYFGGTDILIHNNLDLITYLTNHVIPSSVSVYAQFPLYHIFCAEGMNILNLSSECI